MNSALCCRRRTHACVSSLSSPPHSSSSDSTSPGAKVCVCVCGGGGGGGGGAGRASSQGGGRGGRALGQGEGGGRQVVEPGAKEGTDGWASRGAAWPGIQVFSGSSASAPGPLVPVLSRPCTARQQGADVTALTAHQYQARTLCRRRCLPPSGCPGWWPRSAACAARQCRLPRRSWQMHAGTLHAAAG